MERSALPPAERGRAPEPAANYAVLLPSAFLGVSPGIPEMIVVFAAILLLFGSKNVPKIARSLGKAMEEFRRAAREVNNEIMHAAEDVEEERPRGLPPAPPAEHLVARSAPSAEPPPSDDEASAQSAVSANPVQDPADDAPRG